MQKHDIILITYYQFRRAIYYNSMSNTIKEVVSVVTGKEPTIKCSLSHPISYICMDYHCRAAPTTFCQNKQCQSCSSNHQCCECLRLSSLAKVLVKLSKQGSLFLDRLQEIVNQCFSELQQKIKSLEESLSISYLNQQQVSMIQKIYNETSVEELETEKVTELYRKLRRVTVQTDKIAEDCLMNFSDNCQQQTQKLLELEETILKEYQNQIKGQIEQNIPKFNPKLAQEHEQLRKKCLSFEARQQKSSEKISKLQNEIQTLKHSLVRAEEEVIEVSALARKWQNNYETMKTQKVILEERKQHVQEELMQEQKNKNELKTIIQNLKTEIESKSQSLLLLEKYAKKYQLSASSIVLPSEDKIIAFIMKCLNNPKKLELLYRASQHNFEAKYFHKMCDDIEHTFILIKNCFDRRIAAYTPLKWKSTPNFTFLSDEKKETFLLALDSEEKMTLNDPQRAIRCSRDWGPIFGDSDLGLTNCCNVNNGSYACFPGSFNSEKKYVRSQQSIKSFAGVQSGDKFKVVEYQVYHVCW